MRSTPACAGMRKGRESPTTFPMASKRQGRDNPSSNPTFSISRADDLAAARRIPRRPLFQRPITSPCACCRGGAFVRGTHLGSEGDCLLIPSRNYRRNRQITLGGYEVGCWVLVAHNKSRSSEGGKPAARRLSGRAPRRAAQAAIIRREQRRPGEGWKAELAVRNAPRKGALFIMVRRSLEGEQ